MKKNKNILLKILSLLCVCGVAISTLTLTGCGNRASRRGGDPVLEDVEFNGGANFVTSNIGNLTNQEAFDMMVDNPASIFTFLNLVDEVVLRGNFDIDEDSIVEFWEEFQTEIPDVEAWMLQGGFDTEEDVLRLLELEELREAAAADLVDIPDEQIQAVFDEWFDDESTDLEEVRDEIHDTLLEEALRELSIPEVARLRNEADLVIYNDALAREYSRFLGNFMVEGVDADDHTTTDEPDDDEVIASVDGVDITIGQVFAALSGQIGLETAFERFDAEIMSANFSVEPEVINGLIAEYREEFGAEFYEILESSGFDTEQDLYDFLERGQLEELMISEYFTPSEDRLREMHAAMGETVSGSHILVEDFDLAEDLISQLENANDFSETFAELAAEYSSCPSASNGGDLGRWSRGNMVEQFDDVIFDLQVGEFSLSPVETDFGYHIIYKTGDTPEFEEVRDELVEQELAQLQQTPGVLDNVLMSFRQEAGIEFTDPTLQSRFEHLVANGWQNDEADWQDDGDWDDEGDFDLDDEGDWNDDDWDDDWDDWDDDWDDWDEDWDDWDEDWDGDWDGDWDDWDDDWDEDWDDWDEDGDWNEDWDEDE